VRVFFDPKGVERGAGAFLILNYEKFQNERARALTKEVVRLQPDLLVLDEVQLVKQRGNTVSKRRGALVGMRQRLRKTRVLVMSATPVINDISEGVSLLEFATGKTLNLKTRSTVDNALALHYELVRHGMRFRLNYEQSLNVRQIKAQDDNLLDTLKQQRRDALAIEQTLLPVKLEAIRKAIRSGTVIYLDYVEGMVPVVRSFVESLGLSVAEYTGDTDTAEREQVKGRFINGTIDVLIGSRAIGLGVDGLQRRCDQLIMLSLPWTAAAYEQVIGRVYRQGSTFKTVDVLLPQVIVAMDGERWSWDEQRYRLVEDKRTLSDCAVDGVIPTHLSVNREEFTRKVRAALDKLIENSFEAVPCR
jgi:superfamily II DNA or RNA helicase